MDYKLKLKAEQLKDELKSNRKLEIEVKFSNCLGLLSKELTESQMIIVGNILRYGLVDKIHNIIDDYDKVL